MKKRNTQFLHFSIILVLIMVNSCTEKPDVIIDDPKSLSVSVNGRVLDINNDDPIKEAKIFIQDIQASAMISNKEGYFKSDPNLTKPYSGKNEIIIKIEKDDYIFKGFVKNGKIRKINPGENDLGVFRLTKHSKLKITEEIDSTTKKQKTGPKIDMFRVAFYVKILPVEIVNKISIIHIDDTIVYNTNNPDAKLNEIFEGNEFTLIRQSMNRSVQLTFEEFTPPPIKFMDEKCNEYSPLILRVEPDNTITKIDCR